MMDMSQSNSIVASGFVSIWHPTSRKPVRDIVFVYVADKGQIIRRLMTYEYFGYPADFLEKTRASVEKVTRADVLRVAREHLRPDNMQILVVGRPVDFDQPLSVLGQVSEIDITIPMP